MMENEYELIVSQGQRPFIKTLGAGVCFTLVLYYLFLIAMDIFGTGTYQNDRHSYGSNLWMIGCLLAAGFNLAKTKTVLIDTNKDKLISRFSVGPFSRDVVSSVPNLEYVAVFKDAKERFQVNLWYKGNKHYNMYAFESEQSAFVFASQVAEKLKLDLLDSTVKGNFKWMERSF